MTTKSRKLQLRVVFDTSVLFTSVASDLMRAEAVTLIREHAKHNDLTITWYLPRVVKEEREYQMMKSASSLLPSLEKLERVLGHKLAITSETVNEHIARGIEKQMTQFTLNTLELDASAVNWKRLMQDAVFRRPPFEAGDKEKGFRDALIAETFVQLVEQSPTTPAVCRIVLVSDDELLVSSIRARTVERNNVTLLSSLEDLGGLLNTLASEVSEEFVNNLRKVASSYFYDFDKKEGLYAKWDIQKTIRESFAKELGELPPDAQQRRNDSTWLLGSARFIKKDRKRVYWNSRVTINAQSFTLEEKSLADPPYGFGALSNAQKEAGAGSTSAGPGALGPVEKMGALAAIALVGQKMPIPHKKGQSIFDISWSADVAQTNRLTAPKLEGLTFAGTTWT